MLADIHTSIHTEYIHACIHACIHGCMDARMCIPVNTRTWLVRSLFITLTGRFGVVGIKSTRQGSNTEPARDLCCGKHAMACIRMQTRKLKQLEGGTENALGPGGNTGTVPTQASASVCVTFRAPRGPAASSRPFLLCKSCTCS